MDPVRREIIRDSGIGDNTLPDPNDTLERVPEEIDEEDQFPPQPPPQIIMPDPPAGAAAANPAAVTPAQLQSLPLFDGKRGEGFINWLECLETAQVTYGWTIDSLIQVAKAKGGAAVAEWDRGNRLRGVHPQAWEGVNGYKTLLGKRFGPKYTAATAVNAVADLKQRPRESCAQFLDRVVLAVNRQNFNIPDVQKASAVYRSVFDAAIISHFGAGLKDEISSVVLGQADAPNTVSGMLDAAEAVEAEMAKVGPPGASALAVHDGQEDMDPLADLTARFEELVAAIGWNRKKPFDKSKVKCYNCNKPGHFRNECPEPRRPTGRDGVAPAGRRRPQGGRRPQYAVEEEEDPEPSAEEEVVDDEGDFSGNF